MATETKKPSLRYPLESVPDYMILTPSRYSNRQKFEASGPPAGPPIILPIPELPGLVSSQSYGQLSGALNNLIAGGLATAYDEIQDGGKNFDVSAVAERLKENANNATGPVLRELAAGAAGGLVGINGPQFQSFASGQISNPQIELLYGGPSLRSYAMQWSFSPKSEAEAVAVYEIVKSLKQQHLPTKLKGDKTGMLRVPNVFDIRLFVDGKPAEYYQKFFTCAMVSMSVKQDNSGSHITLPNGSPCVSTLQCSFKEIRPCFSDDFSDNI